MFKDTKKMSSLAFVGALLLALVVDILGILIPFIGTIFVFLMRVSFWLSGYHLKGAETTTVASALAEALPIVPACTAFVVASYMINKKNIASMKKNEKTEKKEKASH